MYKKTFLAVLTILLVFGCKAVQADDVPVEIPQESVFIRNGDNIIFNGAVPLPDAGTIPLVDSAGTSHDVNTRSVLGLLASLDAESDAFSISNLQYYSSFSSLYLKCITTDSAYCDNWQYIVDGNSPATGMDSTILSGGERVGIYFGTPNRVFLSKESIASGESVVGKSERYEYLSNTWSPRTGVTIGVTTPNPDDPFSPTVLFSKTVDENGTAEFALNTVGSYDVGIAEDYYFPTVRLLVTPLQPVTPTGGGATSLVIFNTAVSSPKHMYSSEKAVEYLQGMQHDDGSFGPDLYTDWVAVAFGSAGISGTAKEKLVAHLRSRSGEEMMLTDNERRSMALLSLGENPYAFNGINYIEKITASFDGMQFGDPELVNDDIFALIPLSRAGYTASNTEIKNDIVFLLSKQRADGSWEGSVDLTAAAVQALLSYKEIDGVSLSLEKAVLYLKEGQKNDGSFGSVYTTSWVSGAMHALGEDWKKNENGVLDFFANAQHPDGALLPETETTENRIWATSYAVASGSSWAEVMKPVSKPEIRTVIKAESTVTLKAEAALVPEWLTTEPLYTAVSEESARGVLAANVEASRTQIPGVVGVVALSILLGFGIYSKFPKTQ